MPGKILGNVAVPSSLKQRKGTGSSSHSKSEMEKPGYPATLSEPSTWVDQHGNYLFRYALMRLRNRDLAENFVQETFLAALSGRQSFSGRSSEKTWMVGILKHKIADYYRKSFRENPVTDLQLDEEQTIDEFYDAVGHPKQYPKDWMPDAEALLYSKEFWETVHHCLEQLPPRTAQAFVMREMEGNSTEEICDVLDITQANLWVMLHRARLQMRELLETYWFDKKSQNYPGSNLPGGAPERGKGGERRRGLPGSWL